MVPGCDCEQVCMFKSLVTVNMVCGCCSPRSSLCEQLFFCGCPLGWGSGFSMLGIEVSEDFS